MLKEVSSLLTRIGLSHEASKTYLYILSNSPVFEPELRKRLPDLNLKLHIQQLNAIPLITFDFDKNMNIIYYALKPDTAFKAISDQEIWSLAPSTKSLQTSQQKEIEQFIVTCNKVGKSLLSRYKRRSTIGLNSIRIARDSTQLATFLCETISLASSEILSVSSQPVLPKIALIWNELQGKIKSGVTYRRIVDLWEMGYHGYEIKRRDVIESGVELRIIDRAKLERKFYIIDDTYVVLFSPDVSKTAAFTLQGQVIKNKALSKKFRTYFHELYVDSISAVNVLEYMALIRESLLKGAMKVLDDTGMTWLKTLIDYGNFAEWPELRQTTKETITKLAIKNNLVVEDSGFRMGVSPNYNWSFEDITQYQKITRKKD